jgi:hypothetical protein
MDRVKTPWRLGRCGLSVGYINMRIRITIVCLLTALAAVGCSSLHHDQAAAGMGGPGEFGLDSDAVEVSESQLPDSRATLADPGF